MASFLLKTLQVDNSTQNSHACGSYKLFALSATLGGTEKHQRTDHPAQADIILFCDGGPAPYQAAILQSELYQRFPEKCFVFCDVDQPLALLPGVYASIERRWHDPHWTCAGLYAHITNVDRFERQPFAPDAPWLFTFAGSCCNHPVRQSLRQLSHPRFHLLDTSGQTVAAYTAGDTEAINTLNRNYQQLVRDSKFVLCPRGVGCSSIRLFETMRMGRAPVIISDDWVAPAGPAWSDFSLRVPEARVRDLPVLLEGLEPRAREMGDRARQEWERWFSDKMLCETVVDWCLNIKAGGRTGSKWFRRRKYFQLLRPFHFRHYLRCQKQRLAAAWAGRAGGAKG